MPILSQRDYKSCLEATACTPGLTAIFARAKMGKTFLADALVSYAMRTAGMGTYSPKLSTEVVDAASRTFLAPEAIDVAIDAGVITEEAANEWAKAALLALSLEDFSSVRHAIAFSTDISIRDIEEKISELNVKVDRMHTAAYVLPKGNSGKSDGNLYLTVANAGSFSKGEPMVCVSPTGKASFITSGVGYRLATTSEIRSSALSKVTGLLNEGSFHDTAPRSLATKVEEWKNADEIKKNDAVWFDFKSDDGEIEEDSEHWAVFTSHGITLVNKLQDGFSEKEAPAQLSELDFVKNLMRSNNTSPTGSTVSYDDVVTSYPRLAYHLLVRHDIVAAVLGNNQRKVDRFGMELKNLAALMQLTSAPVLVETEDKATAAYGAVARTSSIERRSTTIELKTANAGLDYSVTESLATCALGALLINPVLHISVLDLTMLYDTAVKSTTRKGGLDSIQLNIMQHISGVARRCGAIVIAETRDDFFADATESMAITARDTLGANSRIAIHITESDNEDDASRNIWIRVKGYGECDDAEYELANVRLEHYPEAVVRSGTVFEPFYKVFWHQAGEWVIGTARRLLGK